MSDEYSPDALYAAVNTHARTNTILLSQGLIKTEQPDAHPQSDPRSGTFISIILIGWQAYRKYAPQTSLTPCGLFANILRKSEFPIEFSSMNTPEFEHPYHALLQNLIPDDPLMAGVPRELWTLSIEQVAFLLGRTAKSVKVDVTRAPHTLPPIMRVPGSRKLRVRVVDMLKWMDELSKLEIERRRQAAALAKAHGVEMRQPRALLYARGRRVAVAASTSSSEPRERPPTSGSKRKKVA